MPTYATIQTLRLMVVVVLLSPFMYIYLATVDMLPPLDLRHLFHDSESHYRALLKFTLANELATMLIHGAVMTGMDLWRLLVKLFTHLLQRRRGKSVTIEIVKVKSIWQSNRPCTPQTDLNAWKKKIVLTAVECQEKGVVLSEPPFPFVQYWNPLYQLKAKTLEKKKKRADYVQRFSRPALSV